MSGVTDVPAIGSTGLEGLARRLLELLGRVSGLESTYLTFIDWDREVQEILYARNAGAMTIPEGLRVAWADTLCRRALDGGPACTSDVPGRYPDSAAARDLGINTYVTSAITGPDGSVFGTLCGASTERVPVDDATRLILETLADMVAMQLANEASARKVAEQARQLEEANAALERANAALEHLALTDPLTNVGNRRALERDLARVCSSAARRNEPVCVLSLDIDRFKEINDAHGHEAGDAVLRAVAECLRSNTRDEDVISRFGGDEFVVVLPAADDILGRQVAERIRVAIAETTVGATGAGVTASVSIGVASGAPPECHALLPRADAALYEAKRAGRNQLATR